VHNLLTELLAVEETPKVTLQIPANGDAKARSLIVRHMLDKASGRLAALDIPEASSIAVLERARSLAEDHGLAAVRSGTAAVYVANDYSKAVLWPAPFPQRIEVGIEFHLSDAVDLLDPAHCYLLTVSRGGAALYRADAMSLEAVELVDIPANLAAATEHLDLERQSQLHQAQSGGRGASTAVHHGIGVGEGRDVEELRNYLRAIDQGVRIAIADAPAPVALVGADDVPSEYRAITRIDKVVDEVARINPEAVGSTDLRQLANDVLATARAAAAETARHHIADLVPSGKGSQDIAEIVEAASEGRVDTLLLGPREQWGDPAQQRRLNRAVVRTLRQRGRAMRDDGLSDSVVAASFRY